MSRRLGIGILVASGFAAGCVATELALRAFQPQPLALAHRLPSGVVVHRPSTTVVYEREEFRHEISTNSLGLRGPEVALVPDPGSTRIFLLGDSYFEGAQVAANDHLRRRLEVLGGREGHARPREVINGGVSGTGNAAKLRLWRHLGESLHPAIVVVGVTTGNDVLDDWRNANFVVQAGVARERTPAPRPLLRRGYETVRDELAGRSHLFQLARNALHVFAGTDAATRYQSLVEHRRMLHRADASAGRAAKWRRSLLYLDHLRLDLLAVGARWLVVAVPSRYQIDDEEWAAFDPEGRLDRDAPRRELREWCEARDVPYLDLHHPLHDAHLRERAYYRRDGHWNPRGHEVAAEEIHRFLVTRWGL